MTDNLSMTVPNAESAFHLFTAACYLLPLFGAWLADNVLGKYRVVLYLSGFYCLGLPPLSPLGCSLLPTCNVDEGESPTCLHEAETHQLFFTWGLKVSDR